MLTRAGERRRASRRLRCRIVTTRTFALVLAGGLALAVALFALGAALDLPAFEWAGAGAVVVVLVARGVWGAGDSPRDSIVWASVLAGVIAVALLAQLLFG